ncbi:MAG TPA: TRAM domain-containing protein [Vicinamibacterales bacterium]|nr:TRAM domain-containing protein [Vicinamibacterales bacterium]
MPSALRPNSEVVLTAEKPVTGGRMLARHDGQVVFVAGAIPGERVRARVERVSKQLAFAETVEVLDCSPDRRSAGVDWACGGSLYAHIAYERQRVLKSELIADAFARIGKMQLPGPVPVMASEEQGYRMRARLHAQSGMFGFFREGTHELCGAGPTRQLLPATLNALEHLQTALSDAAITGVTSCEISENAGASERVALIEMAPSLRAPLHFGPVAGITGAVFADHQSARLAVAYGSPYVVDAIDGPGGAVTLTHHVQSFFQSNRYLLSPLVARLLAHVPDGSVTDLYAGVGLFSVSLAARGVGRIVAVEGDRSSVRDLESNAEAYGAAIRVEHASVENYLGGGGVAKPDTLVLDPPRTGVSSEALSGILGLKPPRLVYLSCDLATVARDVRRLVEAGYSLSHIEAFDLFPNTAHVETLVVLVT